MLTTWTAPDYAATAMSMRGAVSLALPDDRAEARRLLLAVRRELAERQACR